MGAPRLTLVLLGTGCFTLATWLAPRFDALNSRRETGLLAQTLGESRRLFANHFFTRSDVYFHSGYYPSIFDQAAMKSENHLAGRAAGHEEKNPAHGEVGHVHSEGEEEHDFLGKPKDPLDAFSRHFFVAQHTHLTEKGTNAPREILPWLQLSARLDPKLIESYTVGAFWLRELHKNDEAEQFLREGLRQNPQSYEIMFELGRGYFDKRDYDRARNVLEMALQRWREQENPKPVEQQNRFAAEQIVNYLARVEHRAGNLERAISWLELLKKVSPNPDQIDRRIAEVRAGKPLEAE
jgi:tetratricopeptide (TPR) repeat protein